MDNACGKCESCETGNEQYCHAGFTVTYNSPIDDPVGFTYGGYSQRIVADESFVLKMPANLELTGTDPLLCAGITTYSTLQYWSVTKGMDVGLGGLGGPGHMGVSFAHSTGAHTVMIITTPEKGNMMPSHLELMNFLYPPILSDVEVISMDQIQEAFERFVKSDRRYFT